MTEFFEGTSLGNLSDQDFGEILNEAIELDEHSRGLGLTDGLVFLGFWRTRAGGNLRVGMRRGGDFVGIQSVDHQGHPIRGNIDVVLQRLLLSELPTTTSCAVQMNWSVSHFFSNEPKPVAHVTCVEASPGTPARAIGIPLFSNLAAQKGLDLKLGLVAVTDPKDNPIINILNNDALKAGLKLAGQFNPVFSSTVSYINAITKGLTEKSRRNYKLAEWRCGLSTDQRDSMPLIEGEYILLDGQLRIEGYDEEIRWEALKWNAQTDRVEYDGKPLTNSHVIINIRPTQEPDTNETPAAAAGTQDNATGATRRRSRQS